MKDSGNVLKYWTNWHGFESFNEFELKETLYVPTLKKMPMNTHKTNPLVIT